MPLVRFPVRNEYGLGNPELYGDVEREDPKAVLQGVAVAGLVGILRQLGDLAEFAAEVFHGLQEEVTITSSRSRKLMGRIQRIESALPSLEKSMLAQKSHIHFAYTRGSVWRAHPQIEQNHFIYGDLPEFIMDSYEECSDPPRLHLLDRFDRGGPGSCLKRYSDPTFFKKASALSRELNSEKLSKSRRSSRSKKKKSRKRAVSSRDPSISNHTDRPQFASLQAGVQNPFSPSHTVSSHDDTIKSNHEEQQIDYDLRTNSSYIECVFHSTDPIKPEYLEPEKASFSSSPMLPDNSTSDLASVDENRDVDNDNFVQSPLTEQIRASSSSVSWEEKEEIKEPTVHQHEHVEATEILQTEFDEDDEEKEEINNSIEEMEFSFDSEGLFIAMPSRITPGDLDSEPDNFMDALNTIESESETDTDYQTKREVERSFSVNNDRASDEIHGKLAHYSVDLPLNQKGQEVERSFSFNNEGANNELASDQTIQDVEQTCMFSNDTNKDGMNEFVVDNAVITSSIIASCSAAHGGSHHEPLFDDHISSQFREHEELRELSEEAVVDISVNNWIAESAKAESPTNHSGPREVNQQNLVGNEVQNASGECQTDSIGNSGVQSVQFWTNGGLLGLEPSKPPFGAPNTASESLVAKDKDVGKFSFAESNGKPDELAQSSEIIDRNSSKCSTSYQNDSNAISDKKTSWRFLSAVLDTKREKNGYFQLGNSFNNNLAHSFGRINGIIPKNEQEVSADGRALCGQASQGDMSNGSRISVLSNRIPLNDFQRSLVNIHGRGYRALKGIGSPMHSPSSSPPLQHMKISFLPANNMGTSKLKLKFPDGSFGHETGSYMLPSFQLVPEPSSSHHDIGSESDDDTFCRSSPYMSDDRLDNESESDSEQWDSDDSPHNNANDAYHSMHNMSLNENVSTSTESEENRHESVDVDYGFQSSYAGKCTEPTQANLLPDLPSLGAMNPLFEQEMKTLSDENKLTKSHLFEECTPQPPPFPSSEWRNVKPNPDFTIAEQESNFKEFNQENDLKLLSPTIRPQPNPNLVKQQILGSIVTQQSNPNFAKQQLETNKDVALPPQRESNERRSNGKKEVSQIGKGRVVDENDFLHQIRTQSFNLRRTGTLTEKPNVTTAPQTNAKVAAILEKANAIRQVVGSDDGEDEDSWSEA